MDMTVHVMGNSLLYWTQSLYEAGLLGNGSRVMGLTSEGNYLAMDGYGPVSVAKVAMEAIIRQIGWELGHAGITANTIQAGVTPTRALTKITENWESWVKAPRNAIQWAGRQLQKILRLQFQCFYSLRLILLIVL